MRWRNRVKQNFVAGVILVGPLVLTLFILRLLVNWSLQLINPVVAGTRLGEFIQDTALAQMTAAVLIVLAVTVIGAVAKWSVGQHLFGNVGRIIHVVPLVNTIYGSIKQVATSLVDRESEYESVVLVEKPRLGLYAIGLLTNEGIREFDEAADESMMAVYMPNSPNPTNGQLVMVPDDQVYETDMSVRRGMRLIVTTGIGSREEELEEYVDDVAPVTESGD
jgi:uncharacterized membrane protein